MGRFFTNWKFTYALALVLLVGMVALRGWDPLPLQILRDKTFDLYQRIKPREPPPGVKVPVRIVDIDDESLAAIGQWPWPRTVIARLIRTLTDRYHVAAIAFDIVFAEPDRLSPSTLAKTLPNLTPAAKQDLLSMPDNDTVLANTLKGRRVVLGQATLSRGTPPPADDLPRKMGIAVRNITTYKLPPLSSELLNFPNVQRNLPQLEKAAAGLGFFSFFPDPDNVVRRVPLLLSVNGQIYPGLAVEALRVALNRQSILVEQDANGPVDVKLAANLSLPTDDTGHAWIYYAPYSRNRSVSAKDVLAGTVPLQKLAGDIVLVGTSAAGLQDIRATPLADALPGVDVHAQLLEDLLTGATLSRPNYAKWLEPGIIVVAGVLLAVIVPLGGALWSLFAILLVAGGVVGGSWYMFAERHELIGFAYPVICSALLYTYFTFMNYVREERAKNQVRGAFSQYLSPAMVEELAENPERLKLGGEMRNMTLLFSDIRGFTAISEQFRGNPVGLVSLINRFLTPMTAIIMDRKGTIDKYMGDCIMAFWNAPIEDHEQIDHAVDAALTMIAEIERLNGVIEEEAKAEGRRFFPIKVGVGINTGEVFVGNMGSDQRFDYSVIGDDVNLASRLEGQSKTYGVTIVIGEHTQAHAGRFATLELDLIRVKGKQEAVRIYTVLGDSDVREGAGFQALQARHDEALAAYRAQDWDRAGALFDACRQMWPSLGGLYELYAERMAEFRASPPGPDWDGVYVASSK